jgi:hypothetical protein
LRTSPVYLMQNSDLARQVAVLHVSNVSYKEG